MSGTFYSSAAPGEPSFCKVGDRVKKGQTVGIIEAMKLMNEIEVSIVVTKPITHATIESQSDEARLKDSVRLAHT